MANQTKPNNNAAALDASGQLGAEGPLNIFGKIQLGELLFENERVQIYSALTAQGVPVIAKRLRAGMQTIENIAMLRREHELLGALKDVPIRKSYGLVGTQGLTCLVLEDVDGDTLRSYCQRPRVTRERILRLICELCDVLAMLHSRGIVHKDINPQNILVRRSDDRPVLIDFGIAARMSNEQVAFESVKFLEGTLPYISPEQTGRTGHPLDERSDLYALGATIYELLSGRPPFDGSEAIDIVHAHLATLATPLHELDPTIPPILSAITTKLLAKAPEDRYRSALGLKHDLQLALAGLAQPGTQVVNFPLGQLDVPLRLRLPQHLYGREAELAKMASCWERVERGGNAFVAIGGPSGVGKTALIRELSSSILRTRAHFMAGKFEELRRDVPFDAVVQACLAHIATMNMTSEIDMAAWRNRLCAELGSSGQQMIDLLPDLAAILPTQDLHGLMTPSEARHRLQQQFIKFFRAAGGDSRPMVLFLDDLQWADMASLQLVDDLVMNPALAGLYIIGAYRDNELTATHALTPYLATWRQHAPDFEAFSLPPINATAVGQMCAAALQWDLEQTRSLAATIHNRTAGNPFFARQLLKTLVADGLVYFDLHSCQWQANHEAIQAVSVSEHVVELLKNRLKILPVDVQNFLVRAAYIGDRFDLQQMRTAFVAPLPVLYACLHHAVSEELLIPQGGRYSDLQAIISEWEESHSADPTALDGFVFTFAHDRIQEACQKLVNESEVQLIRLEIARALIAGGANANPKDHQDALYHFNAVEALIPEQEERVKLARLNLEAGGRASQSSAWDIALSFYLAGTRFLGEQGWEVEPVLMRQLYLGTAATLMLLGDTEATDQCFDALLAHSTSGYQRAEIRHQRCVLLVSLHRNNEAIDVGLAGLKDLGVRVPFTNPPYAIILLIAAKINWQLSRITDREILELPEMTDPQQLLICRILHEIIHPCMMVRETLAVYLVNLGVTHILKNGQCVYAAAPFLYMSVVLGGLSVFLNKKFWWGDGVRRLHRIYREFSRKWPDQHLGERMDLVYMLFAAHWHQGYLEALLRLEPMATAFVDRGDSMFGSYAIIFQIDSFFFNGLNLAAAEVVVSKRLDCVEHFIKEPYRTSWKKTRSAFHVLREGTIADLSRYAADMKMLESGTVEELTCYCADRLLKGTLLYLAGDFAPAYKTMRESQRAGMDKAFAGNQKVASFHLTMVLVASELYLQCPWWQRFGLRWRIWRSRKMLNLFTTMSMENFGYKELIATAVWTAIKSHPGKGFTQMFEQAIAMARTSGVVLDEAVACENYGRALLRHGFGALAVRPFVNAIHAYEVWGASSKVKELETLVLTMDPQAIVHAQPVASTTTRSSRHRSQQHSESTQGTTSQISASLDAPTLVRAFQALSGEIKLDALKTRLINLVCENSGARRAVLLWRSEHKGQQSDEYKVVAMRGTDGSVSLDIGASAQTQVPMAALSYVSRSGRPLIVADVTKEEPWKSERDLSARNVKSVLCMPIVAAGVTKGLLYLENDLSAQTFTSERVEILSLLSGQMAISIENALLYERVLSSLAAEQDARHREQISHQEYIHTEGARRQLVASLEAAEAVQKSLLILDRSPLNYQLAHLYVPADNAGGDWLSSFYDPGHGWLFLFLGDVTGHGISAALLTAAASGAATSAIEQIKNSAVGGATYQISGLDKDADHPLQTALEHIARALDAAVRATTHATKQLMTMVMVGVDLHSGHVVYLNAGHPSILVGAERARSILVGGSPFGFSSKMQCGRETFRLDPGDKILMMSDGLMGNVDSEGRKLRFTVIRDIFQRHQEPEPVIAEISALVDAFAHGDLADDTACVVFRWLGPTSRD